jgi:hypothetical protein
MLRGMGMSVSMAGAVFCLLGWAGMVFGPRPLVVLGAIGFVVGALGHGLQSHSDIATPQHTDRLSRTLRYSFITLTALFFSCLILFFLLSFRDGGGVADFPALEARSTYELNNHGSKTQVSRSHYVANATLFATGWSALALAVNLSAFYRHRYGRAPE